MRRRAKLVQREKPPIEVEVTEEEGQVLAAHSAGILKMWEGILADGAAEGEAFEPCHHACAALMLLIPADHEGMVLQAEIFRRAGIKVDLAEVAAPVGEWTAESICAHARTCRVPSPVPPLKVWWPEPRPDATGGRTPVPVICYRHEADAVAGMTQVCGAVVRDVMKQVGHDGPPCEHLVCAVRRRYAKQRPDVAATERDIAARAGATMPDESHPDIEALLAAPHDAHEVESARALDHLRSCTLIHDEARWPLIEVVIDQTTRPVPVPTATGPRLSWPSPVWS